MKRKLTLSKETLRILDDELLTRVVGGGGSHDGKDDKHDKHPHGKGHNRRSGTGNSGDNGSCAN